VAGFHAVRSSQVRAVGTAFLRARPWVVAPVAAINLVCLLRAGAPAAQLRVLGPGIAALLGFFVYEAVRFRREVVREAQLRRSLVVTAAALLLACAASGGPRSPMVPLLLAPVGVAFAAFGRGRGNTVLLLAVLAGLAGLSLLPAELPFPAIASPQAAVMTVASAAGSLVLLWIGVTGLTTAYARSGEALASTRDGMLEAMNERMRGAESLGARVAHEIRNPLTAIKGLVQLLARGEHEARDQKRLEVVLAEVGRVEETLGAYLSFARPLAELRPERVDLAVLLAELAALLEARAEAGGVRVVVLAQAAAIVGDRRRLQEALLNLASNALEATPPGGTLTLGVTHKGGGACVTVIDDGRGMTPEQLARLGTPFVSERPGGTGLGVTLARAVVLQHGGRMTHTSAVGQGTRVTLTLPGEPGGALPDGEDPDRR
jgi:signal transduction histidine kinase